MSQPANTLYPIVPCGSLTLYVTSPLISYRSFLLFFHSSNIFLCLKYQIFCTCWCSYLYASKKPTRKKKKKKKNRQNGNSANGEERDILGGEPGASGLPAGALDPADPPMPTKTIYQSPPLQNVHPLPYPPMMYYPPATAYGVSYNTANPSASASLHYAPLMHSHVNYHVNRYQPPPPPPGPIIRDGEEDYDDEGYSCSIM
uniref:Uncharacterized protein n=2 Tax=Rhizophora mucronata TaxID=61149 RepID=A0A2P2MKD9_RHIMU